MQRPRWWRSCAQDETYAFQPLDFHQGFGVGRHRLCPVREPANACGEKCGVWTPTGR
jgi:hypothetical protein